MNTTETIAAQRALLENAYKALNEARRALTGQFPWPIHGKFSQKEAREAAHKTVYEAMNLIKAQDAAPTV